MKIDGLIEEAISIRNRIAQLRFDYTHNAWDRGVEKPGLTDSAAAMRKMEDSSYELEHLLRTEAFLGAK